MDSVPALTNLIAYHSGMQGCRRRFSDPTGLATSIKRADSQDIQWASLVEWTSKYNVGMSNSALGGQISGITALNSTGFDRYRTGGEFYIPYVGTQGYFAVNVFGQRAFLGGTPSPGIKTCVDGPADVGVNMQSERQHTYTEKHIKKNAQDQQQRDGMPIEMLSGDWVQITPEGNFMGCYRGGLNLIGSSQWAEILTSRIDNLVRIRSQTFEHFDSLGERRSYNDEGELTQEVLLTDDQAESFGKKRETYGKELDMDVDSPTGGKSYRKLEDPGATGDWRLRMHVGYLGDLLHLVFTQPSNEQIVSMPRPEDPGVNASEKGDVPVAPATGVAELFIGSDGSVVSRSTKDLISEKVGHIRVPLKKREANDPAGDTSKDGYKRAKRVPFVWGELGGRHLQENEFREWEVDHTEMYRLRGHTKDWDVLQRKKSRCPVAEPGTEKYQPGISVIHQRNDGSVYIQDHWASSIQMLDGDIIIAPSRDLMLQPGRDLAIITPRDTVIKAKKFVDITSSEKDVRIKAQLAMYLYSKYSGILIETSSSDGKEPETPDPDPSYSSPVKGVELTPDSCKYTYPGGLGAGTPPESKQFYGIRLHLREKKASVEIHADKEQCPIIIQTDAIKSPVKIQTTEIDSDIQVITISPNAVISLEAQKQVQLWSKTEDIVLLSSRHILGIAQSTFGVSASNVEVMGTATHIYGGNDEDIIRHLHPASSTSPASKSTGFGIGSPHPHVHRINIRHQHFMESNPNVPGYDMKYVDSELALSEFKFEYRKSYDLGKKIYYTYWQFMKASDKTWKQKEQDDVPENTYPGTDVEFTAYEPGILTIATDPNSDTYAVGSFVPKKEYMLVDLSKSYSEDI